MDPVTDPRCRAVWPIATPTGAIHQCRLSTTHNGWHRDGAWTWTDSHAWIACHHVTTANAQVTPTPTDTGVPFVVGGLT
jgi:hypothetical protein